MKERLNEGDVMKHFPILFGTGSVRTTYMRSIATEFIVVCPRPAVEMLTHHGTAPP